MASVTYSFWVKCFLALKISSPSSFAHALRANHDLLVRRQHQTSIFDPPRKSSPPSRASPRSSSRRASGRKNPGSRTRLAQFHPVLPDARRENHRVARSSPPETARCTRESRSQTPPSRPRVLVPFAAASATSRTSRAPDPTSLQPAFVESCRSTSSMPTPSPSPGKTPQTRRSPHRLLCGNPLCGVIPSSNPPPSRAARANRRAPAEVARNHPQVLPSFDLRQPLRHIPVARPWKPVRRMPSFSCHSSGTGTRVLHRQFVIKRRLERPDAR